MAAHVADAAASVHATMVVPATNSVHVTTVREVRARIAAAETNGVPGKIGPPAKTARRVKIARRAKNAQPGTTDRPARIAARVKSVLPAAKVAATAARHGLPLH